MGNVEQRLQRVEDELAILRMLHTYSHALDYGDEAAFIDCFAEDAVLLWAADLEFRGRAAILGAYRGHAHWPDTLTKHVLAQPCVRLDGNRATVDSMYFVLDRVGNAPTVRSFGRYQDVLGRGADGRWRFLERRTERECKL